MDLAKSFNDRIPNNPLNLVSCMGKRQFFIGQDQEDHVFNPYMSHVHFPANGQPCRDLYPGNGSYKDLNRDHIHSHAFGNRSACGRKVGSRIKYKSQGITSRRHGNIIQTGHIFFQVQNGMPVYQHPLGRYGGQGGPQIQIIFRIFFFRDVHKMTEPFPLHQSRIPCLGIVIHFHGIVLLDGVQLHYQRVR